MYFTIHIRSALLMSPYFQRSQNELIIEALKKDGAKDHMFLDALSPSFMVDDIGYIYMWMYTLFLVFLLYTHTTFYTNLIFVFTHPFYHDTLP